jgi:hypothetical protein
MSFDLRDYITDQTGLISQAFGGKSFESRVSELKAHASFTAFFE